MFRFPPDLTPNRWARVLGEIRSRARETGTAPLDLAVSNPTLVGFCHDRAELASALASDAIESYAPSPRGSERARKSVADFYKKFHGVEISPEKIHLTASTSEAYSWLAKLLCSPSGDNVLVPAPSYPLIENLCGLEGVETREYFSEFDEKSARWTTNFSSIESAIDARTRAIFCVSPNNPTGAVLSAEERARLCEISKTRGIPIVVDEVFSEYASGANGDNCGATATFAGTRDASVFVLGGLSKSAALPQIKVGWILTCGDDAFVARTLRRLDFIADAYLSTSAPAQAAVPALLENSAKIRECIRARLDENERALRAWAEASPHDLRVLPREAGWYAVVQLPRGVSEDALCVDLLRRENVIAHPGYFYDIADAPAPHLVISLITPEATLAAALPRIDAALLRN